MVGCHYRHCSRCLNLSMFCAVRDAMICTPRCDVTRCVKIPTPTPVKTSMNSTPIRVIKNTAHCWGAAFARRINDLRSSSRRAPTIKIAPSTAIGMSSSMNGKRAAIVKSHSPCNIVDERLVAPEETLAVERMMTPATGSAPSMPQITFPIP